MRDQRKEPFRAASLPRALRAGSVCAAILGLVGAAAPSLGQWSTNPASTLGVGFGPGEEAVPKLAVREDGGSYIGWFSNSGGGYVVRIQRLSPAGEAMWAPGGLIVSAHPQSSSLVGWDLRVDSAGGVMASFTDIRSGGDLDVYAYRLDESGAFLWGANGVAVSDNGDYEPDPRIVQTTDGDIVVVWARLPNVGGGSIMMQRYAPDGTPRFAAGGIAVAGQPGEKPGFCEMVASSDGSVLVIWLRNIASFNSPRHIWAQRFDANGAPMWAQPVVVFASSVPIAHHPGLLEDGAGGGLISWHRAVGNQFNCLAHRLDVNGALTFGPSPVEVSTLATQQRFTPSPWFDPSTGQTTVFWEERNLSQSAWGVYGQKLSASGARLWGDSGRELVAVSAVTPRSFVRAARAGSGSIVSWFEAPSNGSPTSRVRGMGVDADGGATWGPVDIASTLSSKDDQEAGAVPGGAILAWQDAASGTPDIVAQRVNADGSLGPPACSADCDTSTGVGVLDIFDFLCFQNEFAAGAPYACECDTSTGGGVCDIFDFLCFQNQFAAGCP